MNKLNKAKKLLKEINKKESFFKDMNNLQLKEYAKTLDAEYAKHKNLDKILVNAYAYAREVTWRLLGKRHYDVQIIGAILLHQGTLAEMRTGEGKAIPINTDIPTPNGWKKAKDIKVGDFLFDRKGMPTKVLGVFPQGKKDTYEIITKDGRTAKASKDHLWTVYNQYSRKNPITLTTEEMLNKGISLKRGYRFHLPTNEAVEYCSQDLLIDPYVMGMFLGNGCKNVNKDFVLSSKDIEVLEILKEKLNAYKYKQSDSNYNCFFYKSNTDRLKIRDINSKYEELLSDTLSGDKYIPEEYKISSIEQRWELIQGLMDSDGNIHKEKDGNRYNVSFSTTSKRLKDDILEVFYSLGLSATWRLGKTKEKNNVRNNQYVIRINIPHEQKVNLFKLSRKKNIAIESSKQNPKKKDYSRIAIVDIKKTEISEEHVCFKVDNEEHLFLTENYIVTHNTLTEILPAYLNSFGRNPVHIITVNDYLAQRDMEEMKPVFEFVGRSVGLIYGEQSLSSKQKAYDADITYGVNSQFGFDYLRDNMVTNKKQLMQRELNYCIIDEADSILIDEAKTPLIISSPASGNETFYKLANHLVSELTAGPDIVEYSKFEQIDHEDEEEEINKLCDYRIDRKSKTVILTNKGVKKVERAFKVKNLAHKENAVIYHHMIQAIYAHEIMIKDVNYIIQNGEIIIVDEFTGRQQIGRRFSDGLHQAIEAKENVTINGEDVTSASITLQNFFRLYKKVSGMSGTAMTDKKEIKEVYSMHVVSIPTNKPVIRKDEETIVYVSEKEKFEAVTNKVKDILYNQNARPILIGTSSIEKSVILSELFKQAGIYHKVLNAKEVEKEAYIIAQAGRIGAVTIATNMAGRGTDIILGGNPEYIVREKLMNLGYSIDDIVESLATLNDEELLNSTDDPEEKNRIKSLLNIRGLYDKLISHEKELCAIDKEKVLAAGGLYVIGTEMYDSRRIDNQLRGRAGRQGDPGNSKFYVSLEDNMISLLGGPSLAAIKDLMDEEQIKDPTIIGLPTTRYHVLRKIKTAQKRIEDQGYEMRKNLLEYDEVDDIERKEVYKYRKAILLNEATEDKEILNNLNKGYQLLASDMSKEIKKNNNKLLESLINRNIVVDSSFSEKEIKKQLLSIFEKFTKDYEISNEVLRTYLLAAIDYSWRDYIVAMQNLKDAVSMTYLSQLKPIEKYKEESVEMFNLFRNDVRLKFATIVYNSINKN